VRLFADLQEMAKGGKVQALTDLVNKLDNELAKVKTQLENTSGTLADDSKTVAEAKKSVKEVSSPCNGQQCVRAESVAHKVA
jgi:archaellum component FlaC